jgi:hypothetical protein
MCFCTYTQAYFCDWTHSLIFSCCPFFSFSHLLSLHQQCHITSNMWLCLHHTRIQVHSHVRAHTLFTHACICICLHIHFHCDMHLLPFVMCTTWGKASWQTRDGINVHAVHVDRFNSYPSICITAPIPILSHGRYTITIVSHRIVYSRFQCLIVGGGLDKVYW